MTHCLSVTTDLFVFRLLSHGISKISVAFLTLKLC